ncbi:methionine ABC transporter substrate-binding protein [Latilactobacillus sakei]|nr:methionine ABC transporter substrate-binding protein [Latilactobacillus sakei]
MQKRYLSVLAGLLIVGVLLTGCRAKKADPNTIVIGASTIPHAAILRHIKPELKKKASHWMSKRSVIMYYLIRL